MNKPLQGLCLLVLFILTFNYSFSQTQGPSCVESVNLGIDADGTSTLSLSGAISNYINVIPADVEVMNQFGGVIQSLPNYSGDSVVIQGACNYAYAGDNVMVRVSNSFSTCMITASFKIDGSIFIMGDIDTIYCYEPVPTGTPSVSSPCGNIDGPTFVADWTDADFDCDSDTAKIIYKEYEAFDKDGNRGVGYDTVVVLKIPELTIDNVSCPEKDTLYWAVNEYPVTTDEDDPLFGYYYVGPHVVVPNGTECDTIWFCAYNGEEIISTYDDNNKCGLFVHKEATQVVDDCEKVWKIKLFLKQTCFGTALTSSSCTFPSFPPDVDDFGPDGLTCDFWLIDLDTFPPYAECKYDGFETVKSGSILDPMGNIIFDEYVQVPSNDHECAAHTYLPKICAYDKKRGVKAVKAIIDGVGTFVLESTSEICTFKEGPFEGTTGTCYKYDERVRLPHTDCPIPVLYEIIDECHIIDSIYCYIQVKDLSAPVAQSEKGLSVVMTNKKAWVKAKSFDEGSYDNCAVNFIVARRTDWQEACVDLCNNVKTDAADCRHPGDGDYESALFPVWATDHDTIWCVKLDSNKHCAPAEGFYANYLDWLWNDPRECNEKLYNSWQYDLMKFATLKKNEHLDEHSFDLLIRSIFKGEIYGEDLGIFDKIKCEVEESCIDQLAIAQVGLQDDFAATFCFYPEELLDAYFDDYKEIGGGWADQVVFDCEDVCEPVTVEILVMDFWCNYSKAWTTVWVEDKSIPKVEKELDDLEITCATFREHGTFVFNGQPSSLEDIAYAAAEGDKEANDILNDTWGTYLTAWVDEHGNLVDEDWNLIDREKEFVDKADCEFTTEKIQKKLQNPHTKVFYWYEIDTVLVEFNDKTITFNQGVVSANCKVECDVETWVDLDHCGEGYIYRKFKFFNGCIYADNNGHIPDTLTRTQRIWIGTNCELNKALFSVPGEVTLDHCSSLTYDDQNNVDFPAMGFNVGYPEYLFDDDCRIVGIAHEDKVFDVVGGDEGCLKIIRTFYFMDWCVEGIPTEYQWYSNPDYSDRVITCEQKIIILDTIAPTVTIDGEDVVDNNHDDCLGDYPFTVLAEDLNCTVEGIFRWELYLNNEFLTSGTGTVGVETILKDLIVEDGYTLKVIVVDECNNEGKIEKDFEIRNSKKPTPVCITFLTIELTPMDLDLDGVLDTAMASIDAEAFNSSSFDVCEEDRNLTFRIEKIDGMGDDTLVTRGEDADGLSLDLGCADVGQQMVRVWVQNRSGNADYCDVLLEVQSNMWDCQENAPLSNASLVQGTILSPLNDPIDQVNLTAQLASGQTFQNVVNTQFSMALPNNAGSVKLTATKDEAKINGVSTLDLVQIQRHILGIDILDNDFEKMAADVNADGRISALDMLEIRSLILGKIETYNYVDAWSFYGPGMTQEINVDQLPANISFTGVRNGDVTMDADGRARNNDALIFEIADRALLAGQTYEIPVSAANFNDILAFQYRLALASNAVELLDLHMHNTIELTENNMHLTNDGFTTSWNDINGVTIEADKPLFTLVIKASQDAMLHEVMSITAGSNVPAVAYNGQEEGFGVAINFTQQVETNEFALYQNIPNPFTDNTRIAFNLPQQADVQLRIMDVSGKIVYQTQQTFNAGVQAFDVQSVQLPAGILYYQIDTEQFTATKKMIKQ